MRANLGWKLAPAARGGRLPTAALPRALRTADPQAVVLHGAAGPAA